MDGKLVNGQVQRGVIKGYPAALDIQELTELILSSGTKLSNDKSTTSKSVESLQQPLGQ